MNDDLTPADGDVTFPVTYQDFLGAKNSRLRGEGEFVVRREEPRYGFTAKTNSMRGKTALVTFRSSQIGHVAVVGRRISFFAQAERSGDNVGPFVFYAATAAEARSAAAYLPRGAEPARGSEAQVFAEQLSLLPAAKSPWTSATNHLIAVNVAAFIAMGFLGAGWFETASMAPYRLYVANNGGATTDGEWWRIVTCMFVHFGALHLFLNMWALFQAGHFMEKLLGRSLFVLAYFGSGITASFATIFWHGDKVWSAGASGAVFGVYGMLMGFALGQRRSVPKETLRPMVRSALTFAGYNLVFGMIVPQIDNAAHIGGLLGGAVFGWLVALPVDREIRRKRWTARWWLGSAAIAAVVAAGVTFSPRFDYRFREELAWEEINREARTEESALVRRQPVTGAMAQPGADAEEFAKWLEREAIPFYETWLNKTAALALTPGQRTARKRDSLSADVQAKLHEYRRVVTEARTRTGASPKTSMPVESGRDR